MTEDQPENLPEAGSDAETAPPSAGRALREARERHGLSVEEVSNRIKFAPRQIEALEADDFTHLPEAAFVRGFVRSYARLVQLDPAPLLAGLPHAPAEPAAPEIRVQAEVPYPGIYTERKGNIIWLGAALVVALILGLSVWLLGGKQNGRHASAPTAQGVKVETLVLPRAVPVSEVPEVEPAAVAPQTPPPQPAKAVPPVPASKPITAASQVPANAQAPAGHPAKQATDAKSGKSTEGKGAQAAPSPVRQSAVPAVKPAIEAAAKGSFEHAAIRMTFDADSWVEVTDKDGKVLLSVVGRTGTEQGVDGTPPFGVTIGYAKGVKLYFKGKPVDLTAHAHSEVARLTLE